MDTTVAGECELHFIIEKNLGLYGAFLGFVCLFLWLVSYFPNQQLFAINVFNYLQMIKLTALSMYTLKLQ